MFIQETRRWPFPSLPFTSSVTTPSSLETIRILIQYNVQSFYSIHYPPFAWTLWSNPNPLHVDDRSSPALSASFHHSVSLSRLSRASRLRWLTDLVGFHCDVRSFGSSILPSFLSSFLLWFQRTSTRLSILYCSYHPLRTYACITLLPKWAFFPYWGSLCV